MSAELIMQPGKQFASRGEFLDSCPPYSVGIEVVAAAPEIIQQPEGPYAIIDHHDDVVRRVTLSACEQTWDLVNLGFTQRFTNSEGEYHPTAYACDPDQDVTLAFHIIKRALVIPSLTDREVDRVDELVGAEGMLDRFGGVPPGRITQRGRKLMERIAWIFDAYNSYRSSGELYHNDPAAHVAVMQEGGKRISAHVAGHGRSRPLDTRYKEAGKVGHCVVVERIGAEALLGACSDGKNAVILWQPRDDGNHQYTYYRRSAMVPFNLPAFYAACNEAEGCPPGQGHGGSDNIGGSPLGVGSTLTPGHMLRIVQENPHILQPPTTPAIS